MKKYISIFLLLSFCSQLLAGLNFTNATSNRVNVGSASSLDDLTVATYLVWVYPTALSAANRRIYQKATTAGGGGYRLATVLSTGGDLELEVDRASVDVVVDTNTGAITTNTWYFLGFTHNTAGLQTDQHIYGGTLTTAMSEFSYATRTVGSGAVNSDNAQDAIIGNNTGAVSAFQGYIAYIAVYNIQLTLAQIEAQRIRPHRFEGDGCVLMMWLGLEGTGQQFDLSGNGNHGTVTGATQIDGPPQIFSLWSAARRFFK